MKDLLIKKNNNKKVILDDDTMKEIQQVLNADKRRKQIEWGIEPSNGLLLYGPPGTGKTTLAKVAAANNEYGFYYSSGSSFVEKYVGIGAKKVRELYTKAKTYVNNYNMPCIIFIDEIDAIGSKRDSSSSGGTREIENTLNQLLIEMDGADSNPNVITIAATNRLDILDSALTRSGRFDKKIELKLPNMESREKLFRLFGSKIKKKSKLPYKKLAEISDGLSGADIEYVIKQATMNAIDANKEKLTPSDIYKILEEFDCKKEERNSIGFIIPDTMTAVACENE